MTANQYCGFLKLPTEVLDIIFGLALEDFRPWNWDPTAHSLALVCRTFNSFTTHRIYENVCIMASAPVTQNAVKPRPWKHQWITPKWSSRVDKDVDVSRSALLMQTLRRNRHLRQFCRRLFIDSGYYNPLPLEPELAFLPAQAIRELTQHITGITELHVKRQPILYGAEFDLFDLVAHVARRASGLKHLTIQNKGGQWLDLAYLPEALGKSAFRLETLELGDVSSRELQRKGARSLDEILRVSLNRINRSHAETT